ncbi:MAG: hypothetical protein CMM52_05355 [Rhodospirillaceae bacterium]|nr:hypothetical protein [Rhodospirillaceae bacterium]|tara:strand:- start:49175 stop:49990 length:816 start_codon:yes stop_codon:yes gene_type:complete
MIRILLLVSLFLIGSLYSSFSYAQGLGLPNQARNEPIEIDADNGIEWQQEAQAYIARGNAKAKQGDVVVHADQLTAYYEKLKEGGTQIWRLDADGNVRIVSPRQTAYGTKGVYDVAKGIFVLTGKPRLVTETEHISARRSLEFWEKKSIAVARGNAVAVKGDKRLQADILTAHFTKAKNGKNEVTRVDAYDNVFVSSPKEIIRGKRGVYNTRTGIVVLRGGVKITRGPDQLNGDAAEVDLNTGVSRLLSSGPGRVRGLFGPKNLRPKSKQR